jgi:hypothetical protein
LFADLGLVFQKPISLTLGYPKIQTKPPNSLLINLEIFLDKSFSDQQMFSSLTFRNKQSRGNTETIKQQAKF